MIFARMFFRSLTSYLTSSPFIFVAYYFSPISQAQGRVDDDIEINNKKNEYISNRRWWYLRWIILWWSLQMRFITSVKRAYRDLRQAEERVRRCFHYTGEEDKWNSMEPENEENNLDEIRTVTLVRAVSGIKLGMLSITFWKVVSDDSPFSWSKLKNIKLGNTSCSGILETWDHIDLWVSGEKVKRGITSSRPSHRRSWLPLRSWYECDPPLRETE